jgi:uncharacterized protein (DUF2236 family)
VHAAEADSFLATYDAYGAEPLTRANRDEYLAQAAVAARHLGVVDPPTTSSALRRLLAAYRPELRATDEARDAARFLLVEPPLPLGHRPGYAMLAAGALATLPLWARRELGMPVIPGADTLLGRPLGTFSAGLIRWALADPALAQDRRTAN